MTPSAYLQCASRFGSFIPSTSGAPLPSYFPISHCGFRAAAPQGGGSVATTGVILSDFGSVAMIGLTGEFSNVWQGKDLGNGQGWEGPGEGPLPAQFLNDMIPKGLEGGSVNDRIPWELGGRGREIPRPGSGS